MKPVERLGAYAQIRILKAPPRPVHVCARGGKDKSIILLKAYGLCQFPRILFCPVPKLNLQKLCGKPPNFFRDVVSTTALDRGVPRMRILKMKH